MWQDAGLGIQVLKRRTTDIIAFGKNGLSSLNCISMPLALFDPYAVQMVWKNHALQDCLSERALQAWLQACRTALRQDEVSPLKIVLGAMRDIHGTGDSVDIHVSKKIALPFVKKELPHSWTLHCHSVTFEGRQLVTLQAPSMIEMPVDSPLVAETATDRVIRLIDRALDNSGGDDRVLQDLRQRVRDGRMHEPIFSTDMPKAYSWDNSASLAIMLGLPLAGSAPSVPSGRISLETKISDRMT